MRTVGTQTESAIRRFSASQTHLVQIVRQDGQEYRFTAHDQFLSTRLFPNFSPDPGIVMFAQSRPSGLQHRTTELRGVVAEDDAPALSGITLKELRSGLLRGALIAISVTDWQFPWVQEPTMFNTYRVAEPRFDESEWIFELAGLTAQLSRKRGRIISPLCGNELGVNDGVHSFCIAVITAHPRTVTAATIDTFVAPTRRTFSCNKSGGTGFTLADHENGYFDFGVARFLTGENAGLEETIELSSQANSTTQILRLQTPMPNAIASGDTVTVVVGCDKQDPTCRDKFGQTVFDNSFNGIPHAPGFDRTIRHPRAT